MGLDVSRSGSRGDKVSQPEESDDELDTGVDVQDDLDQVSSPLPAPASASEQVSAEPRRLHYGEGDEGDEGVPGGVNTGLSEKEKKLMALVVAQQKRMEDMERAISKMTRQVEGPPQRTYGPLPTGALRKGTPLVIHVDGKVVAHGSFFGKSTHARGKDVLAVRLDRFEEKEPLAQRFKFFYDQEIAVTEKGGGLMYKNITTVYSVKDHMIQSDLYPLVVPKVNLGVEVVDTEDEVEEEF